MPSKAEGLAGGEDGSVCHHRHGGEERRGSLALLVGNVGGGGAETRHGTCLLGARPEGTGSLPREAERRAAPAGFGQKTRV